MRAALLLEASYILPQQPGRESVFRPLLVSFLPQCHFLCCPICLVCPYHALFMSTVTYPPSPGSGITSSRKPCLIFPAGFKALPLCIPVSKLALPFSFCIPDPLPPTLPTLHCEFLEGRYKSYVALNTSPSHSQFSSVWEGKEENPVTLKPNDFSRLMRNTSFCSASA